MHLLVLHVASGCPEVAFEKVRAALVDHPEG
jgi:hypothetical protein